MVNLMGVMLRIGVLEYLHDVAHMEPVVVRVVQHPLGDVRYK
jgi:hypothetical protein